ncbi:MAG: ferredoxin family protein [candidate division KSB1 bacterium]|nr:ferredoxin family protein [candidate division KSB1 bacterium]MDZ7305102.1 ferredoxin family protein [candidate division KSB1 bacterium]MDZ7314197.1 ferredoxin family protein [candidate division KSB1 bacterium]
MAGQAFMRIPREEIPWYPTIDADMCTGCGECLDFCANNVFELDDDKKIMTVKNPYNCVVGCNKCAEFCSTGALTFPSQEELVAKLRGLRAKFARPAAAVV